MGCIMTYILFAIRGSSAQSNNDWAVFFLTSIISSIMVGTSYSLTLCKFLKVWVSMSARIECLIGFMSSRNFVMNSLLMTPWRRIWAPSSVMILCLRLIPLILKLDSKRLTNGSMDVDVILLFCISISTNFDPSIFSTRPLTKYWILSRSLK